MKKYLSLMALIVICSGLCPVSHAGPLSDIIALFQKDLVMDIVYADHKNLIQGSEVYLAKNPLDEKILIGNVKKISLTDAQTSIVEVSIHKKHKEKLFESTFFVLMSHPFLKNSVPHIVAVPPEDVSGKKLLEKGAQVKGITFLEYKIAMASEGFRQLMANIKKQNNALLDQLEQYMKSFNTDAFQQKMDELIGQISEFSAEQKETFKNEVFPSLKKMFDSLKEQNTQEKSKDLDKQLKKIENLIDV